MVGQAVEEALWVESYSVDLWVRLLKEHPGWGLLLRWACQTLKGPPRVGTYSLDP